MEFRKNRLALAGLGIIIALIVLALTAALVANNRPYIYVAEDGGGVYFPLFYDHPDLRGHDLRKDEFRGFKLFPPIPYSYSEYNLDEILAGPSLRHVMGTDEQGRDLAARMVHGTRVSLLVGFIAVAIYISIGIVIGALAGYYGGWVEAAVSMRRGWIFAGVTRLSVSMGERPV